MKTQQQAGFAASSSGIQSIQSIQGDIFAVYHRMEAYYEKNNYDHNHTWYFIYFIDEARYVYIPGGIKDDRNTMKSTPTLLGFYERISSPILGTNYYLYIIEERRYIFFNVDNDAHVTATWSHPDPECKALTSFLIEERYDEVDGYAILHMLGFIL